VHALAHITGGGLTENLPRVLPSGTLAAVDASSWQQPAIFDWLQHNGNVADDEMFRTFNCGIGMVVCVAASDALAAIEHLTAHGEDARLIGQIEPSSGAPEVRLV
jgi:phosphoribosylformylglycinamidine cyclo-ligase